MNRRQFLSNAFKAGGLAALYGLGLSYNDAQAVIRGSGGGGGSLEQRWVGFPNSSGTPSSPIGSFITYGTGDADRVYGRLWTATENGTIQAISAYWTQAWNSADGAYFTVYIGTGLRASAIVGSGNNTGAAWTSYVSLNSVGAGLNFNSGDVIRFGVAYCETADTVGLARDDGASDGYIELDTTTSINCALTLPPTTAAWQTSGTSQGLAAIMRYVQR